MESGYRTMLSVATASNSFKWVPNLQLIYHGRHPRNPSPNNRFIYLLHHATNNHPKRNHTTTDSHQNRAPPICHVPPHYRTPPLIVRSKCYNGS
ncbi:hypothetical protein T06_13996 [Trichinella sp. T6]|nr:hypothetical protein T06_2269 [Trichinella sp. T6]KRX53627.1 hypothetical protein T06_13996 [Trichinella sp. T6]